MEQFGKNIRRRARELGLTDAEVARRTGVSARRYSFYVTGDREPDLATLLKICDVLRIPVDQALKSEGREPKDHVQTMIERLLSAVHSLSYDRLRMIVLSAEALADDELPNPLPSRRKKHK
ncbi:helix-turn-helix domain-containing protein [Roseovarius sp.]|uniref:helix-turn-helix domain-containing protein n=1 Tax=Roseovarius sp. TaxID=1486281 RepID=UPI003BAABDAC